MNDGSETQPDNGTGWADMFRGIRGVYTILLNVGIGVHAIDIFVITTVMPAVVAEIGGVEFYTWTTMLYMVGTIVGAASGRYVRSVLGRRKGYVAGGLIFPGGGRRLCRRAQYGHLADFPDHRGFRWRAVDVAVHDPGE